MHVLYSHNEHTTSPARSEHVESTRTADADNAPGVWLESPKHTDSTFRASSRHIVNGLFTDAGHVERTQFRQGRHVVAIKVGCVGQKGGPGKSTLARLIAVGAIKAGATAAIAELDYTQKTILDWAAKREKLRDALQRKGKDPDVIPRVPCQVFSDVDAALAESGRYQFYVLDAPGRTGPEILRIAEASDIAVLPCNPGGDDMTPTVRVFNTLAAKGIARERMLVVLNHIGNASEEAAAREFLAACGAHVLEIGLPEKVIYRSGMTAGLSAAEVRGAAMRERAEAVVAAILAKCMEAKNGRDRQAAQ